MDTKTYVFKNFQDCHYTDLSVLLMFTRRTRQSKLRSDYSHFRLLKFYVYIYLDL